MAVVGNSLRRADGCQPSERLGRFRAAVVRPAKKTCFGRTLGNTRCCATSPCQVTSPRQEHDPFGQHLSEHVPEADLVSVGGDDHRIGGPEFVHLAWHWSADG